MAVGLMDIQSGSFVDILNEYLDRGSEAALGTILEQLKTGDLTLLQLAEWLKLPLTDVDNALRRKNAIGLLGNVLREGVALSAMEISTLEDFLLAKLTDWQCLDAALDGLESLATAYRGNREKIALGLFTVIPSNYSQPTRKTILELCEKLDIAQLRTLGPALGDGILSLCDDERDPRNLLISFRILQAVLATGCISEHATEKYFDHLTSYFPVDFRPPKNDPHGITRKGLRSGLRLSMAAPSLSQYMVPFLVLACKDALECANEKRLKDCLKTLGTCVDHYAPSYVRSILRELYALVATQDVATPQIDFWRRALSCAFGDVPRGLYPDWLHTIPVDLNIPDLVACAAELHPTLYHCVWSVLEKELRPDLPQALAELAERIFDARFHQGGQRHVDQLLPLCDRTCGLAVKLVGGSSKLRLSTLFESCVDPQIILDNIIAEKIRVDTIAAREELLSWIRRERSRIPTAQVIRATVSLLPESEDVCEGALDTINGDVCAAFSATMDDTVGTFLATRIDLWSVVSRYVARDEHPRRAATEFASAFIQHAPRNVGDDLASRISEHSLRDDAAAVLTLLPALAPRIATFSEAFLEALLLADEAETYKLEPLRCVVARMPSAAVRAVLRRLEVNANTRAICTRALLEANGDVASVLAEALQDHQVLQLVLRHPILGPCPPLLAQRILCEQFANAPLASKVVLLCANNDAQEFPLRETVLMALAALPDGDQSPLAEDCIIPILQLVLRVGLAALRSDLDAVVPPLGRLTCLPHLPITRFAALQVLDAVNTVDLRYTSPYRKHLSACFKECANDPRRTIRTFAAAAYSRSLVR